MQVLGRGLWVKCHGGVEVGKEEDKDKVHNAVNPKVVEKSVGRNSYIVHNNSLHTTKKINDHLWEQEYGKSKNDRNNTSLVKA